MADSLIATYLAPQTALTWYRRLTLAFMLYSWVAFFLAVYSLAAHVNQPYGGFLWSWANTDGLYKVDYLSHELSGQLQPLDFLLAIDNEPTPANPHQLYAVAQKVYHERGATVCADNPPPSPPTVTYTIKRAHVISQIRVPITCFTVATIGWVALMQLYYGVVFIYLAYLLFQSTPAPQLTAAHQLPLTLSILMSLFSSVASIHGADTWGINETWVNWLGAFWGNNMLYAMIIAFGCHLITIFPPQSPSTGFYRFRVIWHLLFPLMLLFFSTICIYSGINWSPPVRFLTYFTGSLAPISYVFIFAFAGERYRHLYRNTTDPQVKKQLSRMAVPVLILFILECLTFLKELPLSVALIGVNAAFLLNNLFTLVITIPFFMITFAIIRYQTLPHTATFFRFLISTMFAVTLSQIFASLIIISPANSILWLFVLLTIYSAFWITPKWFGWNNSPLKYLQKLMQAETIDNDDLKAISQDIQNKLDFDLLISTTLQSLVNHLELRFAAIWLVKANNELQLETATDAMPDNLPETLTLWVDQATFCNPKTTPELPSVGQILLPLMISKQHIGLILISERWTDEIFQAADLTVLDNMLGQQIALALNTAKQFRELRLAPEKIKQAERDERQRIAGDLHDLTQAQLNQLNYTLDKVASLLTTDPAEAQRILQRSQMGVNQAAQDLRAILSDLSNEIGSTLPLATVLQEYIDQAKAVYTHLTFIMEVEPLVDKLLATSKKSALLRVCRQSLDNALVHAQAKTIKFVIQLNPQHNIVEFAIIDDGRGFAERPFGELLKGGHRGLHRMSLWLLQYNGHVEIQSSPGQGTIIKGYLPI